MVAANVFSTRLAFFAADGAIPAPAPSLLLSLSSSSLLARRLTFRRADATAAAAAALRISARLLTSAFKTASIVASISSMSY
jgi:hypothetical protein